MLSVPLGGDIREIREFREFKEFREVPEPLVASALNSLNSLNSLFLSSFHNYRTMGGYRYEKVSLR